MSYVNKVITYSVDKINQTMSNIYIVSDGRAAQFRSRFVFNFLILFKRCVPTMALQQTHHGKGPMDVIGGTIKNLVYHKVFSGCKDAVINTPKKFAKFANEISNVDCLFLSKEQLLKEPEEVAKTAPIPTTLKTHTVKWLKEGNSFVNKFY